jgi:hypothetical protein
VDAASERESSFTTPTDLTFFVSREKYKSLDKNIDHDVHDPVRNSRGLLEIKYELV